jgi:hypothetical protein
MKFSVLTLLVFIGIYFLTKSTLKPSISEVSKNIGKIKCTPPNTEEKNSIRHESCCIILDRTSVIIKQSARYEAQY